MTCIQRRHVWERDTLSSFLSWVAVSETVVWVKFTFLLSSSGPTRPNQQGFLPPSAWLPSSPPSPWKQGIICTIVSGASAEVDKAYCTISLLPAVQGRQWGWDEREPRWSVAAPCFLKQWSTILEGMSLNVKCLLQEKILSGAEGKAKTYIKYWHKCPQPARNQKVTSQRGSR